MKKTLLLIALAFIGSATAQTNEQFKLTQDGVAPIVQEIEGKTAADLYNSSVNWVQTTFKNPDKVLKAKIENESIRVDGYKAQAWYYTSIGIKNYYNMQYSITVSFKEGKYRMEFTIGDFTTNTGQKLTYSYPTFFKKDGSVRGTYEEAVPSLEASMNELADALYNYLSGKTQAESSDW